MDSYISHNGSGSVSFVGTPAVHVYTARVLYSSLGLLKVGIKPNRAYTLTAVMAKANEIVKPAKPFLARKSDIDRARAEIKAWADAQEAEIPHVHEGVRTAG